MSGGRVRRAAVMVCGALGLLVVASGVGHAAEDDRGRALLARASTAAYRQDFAGMVEVTWHDDGDRRRQRVEVASEDGVLHVGDDDRLLGSRQAMVRRTGHGWELLSRAAGASVPDPGAKYDLEVDPGPPVAGRPTTRVRAVADGRVRERLFLDVSTGVLLRRDQLDRSGHLDRQVAFVAFTPAAVASQGSARLPRVAAAARADAPKVLTDLPDGIIAPRRVGAGFRLVAAFGKGREVQLFYSDGVVGYSVFADQGPLAWDDLPAGGGWGSVDGTQVRVYSSAAGHVMLWEHDDTTYTCVSDAPLDDVSAFVGAFGHPDQAGVLQQIGRFVTGPFSWD